MRYAYLDYMNKIMMSIQIEVDGDNKDILNDIVNFMRNYKELANIEIYMKEIVTTQEKIEL